MNILKMINDRIGASRSGFSAGKLPVAHISADSMLMVTKTISQIGFIDRSYRLGVWPASQTREQWIHDLAQMCEHGDLRGVSLELLARDRSILAEFTFAFKATRANATFDSAQGVELPLVDRASITGHRLIVQRNGRHAEYRHLLKLNWAEAESLPQRAGDDFESEHAARITGGRQAGTVHVGAEARRRLLVTQTGDEGYAFARDLDHGLDGVFLHRKFGPRGHRFQMGERLTALIIQTPRGLQARNIRTA